MNRQPLHLRRQHGKRGRRGCDLHLPGWKDVAAVRAFRRRKRDDAVAFRADLGRGLAATGLTGPPRPHQIDRPVAADIADARLQELQALITSQQRAAQEAMVGREVSVLYEKAGRLPGQMVGKSDHLHAVHVTDPAGRVGDLVRVRVTASAPNSLAAMRL